MSVVTGGMDDGKNDDGVVPDDEKDALRKTPGQNAPDFGASAQQQVKPAILILTDCGWS